MKNLLNKVKTKLHGKRVVMITAIMAIAALSLSSVAFAEGESTGSAAITSAVTTALATTQSDAMTMISSVLPYALAIVGAIIVVTIGIRVFKKISGR